MGEGSAQPSGLHGRADPVATAARSSSPQSMERGLRRGPVPVGTCDDVPRDSHRSEQSLYRGPSGPHREALTTTSSVAGSRLSVLPLDVQALGFSGCSGITGLVSLPETLGNLPPQTRLSL